MVIKGPISLVYTENRKFLGGIVKILWNGHVHKVVAAFEWVQYKGLIGKAGWM